jgi:glycerol kinase
MVCEVVASIDQGTQSTRVYLFDREARPVASHQVALPQIYPRAGCVSLCFALCRFAPGGPTAPPS